MKNNYIKPQSDIVLLSLNTGCCLVGSSENVEDGGNLEVSSVPAGSPMFLEF